MLLLLVFATAALCSPTKNNDAEDNKVENKREVDRKLDNPMVNYEKCKSKVENKKEDDKIDGEDGNNRHLFSQDSKKGMYIKHYLNSTDFWAAAASDEEQTTGMTIIITNKNTEAFG